MYAAVPTVYNEDVSTITTWRLAMAKDRLTGEEKELLKLIAANESNIAYVKQVAEDDVYYNAQRNKILANVDKLMALVTKLDHTRQTAQHQIDQSRARIVSLKQQLHQIKHKRALEKLKRLTQKVNELHENV